MRKHPVVARMTGSDGREYRGKSAKRRRKLELRISEYEHIIAKRPELKKSYSMPGSMNRSHR